MSQEVVMPRALAALRAADRFFGGGFGDGGGYAGDVEPFDAVKYFVPVDVAGLYVAEGGVGAVVDYVRGALAGSGLEVVDAHSAGFSDDFRDVYAVFSELAQAGGADFVVGKDCGVRGVNAEVREGERDVCLASAEGRL